MRNSKLPALQLDAGLEFRLQAVYFFEAGGVLIGADDDLDLRCNGFPLATFAFQRNY
jgi:hypothetical protein